MAAWTLALPLIEKAISAWSDNDERKTDAQELIAKIKQASDEGERQIYLATLNAMIASDANQAEINKIEAQSKSFFKSGWRPFIGWTCATGFLYAVVIYPLLTWVAVVYDIVPPPNLETGILLSTMGGMLGLGTMRTIEKGKGLTL